ncbi:hypothetical protein NDU88_008576 [Pleurodeles waltl]|uniref:Uncharacterized protein n=1 Tax=Pleurodeles waltl TaxID=8319 RepID=A0AAV7QT63_PLEWA|nr:hypothetical protein NDU88_008576 [Pleurodeles waltl]
MFTTARRVVRCPGEEGREGCGRAMGGPGRRGEAWACLGEASRPAAGAVPPGKPKKAGRATRKLGAEGMQGAPGPTRIPMGMRPQARAKMPGDGRRSVRRPPPLRLPTAEGLLGPQGKEVGGGDRALVGTWVGEEKGGLPQTLGMGGWQQDLGDPRVPLSKKWPTMLQ